MITKTELDNLVKKYENTDFIKDDPIQFIHGCNTKKEAEILGFIASAFAFGNRTAFINSLKNIFNCCDNDICGYIYNGDFNNLKGSFYRIYKDYDIIALFKILHNIYKYEGGLEDLFSNSFITDRGNKYDHYLSNVVNTLYKYAPHNIGIGLNHMIPKAQNGSAMKKMNMFLRWMVRKSSVDIGIWNFMSPADLYIPLDVHVGRQSREMGLLRRKSNDYTAVKELTEKLKEFCPEDPTKYDFAMFAFGVELNKKMNKV